MLFVQYRCKEEMRGFIDVESSEINLENDLSLMELLDNRILLELTTKA